MRLVRFGERGCEEPGVLLPDGRMVDASGEFCDYDEGFFATGGLEALAVWVEEGCPGGGTVDPLVRLGPPVARPSKIVCVGKNYLDHAMEFGEGVPEDEALDCVAGFSTFCDFSERAFQKERGGQWTKGKSADTFAPMGPWLVTADEVADPQALRLWCRVNGEPRQNGWTGDMLHPVRKLVSHISHFMTLLPGDVIATGTPAGVGMGMKPPRYLRPGDLVECGVEGLGELVQRVVAWR